MRRRSLIMTLLTALAAVIAVAIPIIFMAWRNRGRNWDTLPATELEQEVLIFIILELIAAGIIISCGVMIAWWQSRKISAPLIYLAAAVEQLGSATTRPVKTVSGMEEIDLVFDEVELAADRIAGRLSAERQFSADASHQLRTPLASLSMRLEEIEYLSDNPDVKKEAQACLDQVERLTDVVSKLLENSHQIRAQSEAVSLPSIFHQQKTEWDHAFAVAGRKLVFQAGHHGPVLMDRRALSQIVATLVENSLRYGKGITTVTSTPQGRSVIIHFGDQGDGVKEEYAQTIFNKGFSTGGSTGIGLFVARQLAERNGGKLDLVNNKPAVFSLVVPALPEELDPARVLPAGGVIAVGARKRRM